MKKFATLAAVAMFATMTALPAYAAKTTSQDEISMLRAELRALAAEVKQLKAERAQAFTNLEPAAGPTAKPADGKAYSRNEHGAAANAYAGIEPAAGHHLASWTGFYLGAQGGLSHSTTDFGDMNDYYDNQEMNGLTDFGGTGGLYGGYNWQRGSNVFGLEAAWSILSNSDQSCVGDPDCSETLTTDIEHLATIKARAGWVNDNMLFYMSAGPAFGKVEFENNDDGSVFTDSTWTWGYAASVGVEGAITDNVIARVQGEHVALDNETFNDTVNGDPFGSTSQNTSLTGGVAWKFR